MSSTFNLPVTPQVNVLTAAGGTNQTVTYTGVAVSLYIQVTAGSHPVNVVINGQPSFQMDETSGGLHFRHNDLHITSVQIQNVISGADNCTVLLIAGVVNA